MTAMGWFITADVGEFLTEAGEFLRAEPALYQRLGYRPVEDRVVLSFQRVPRGLRFTRERTTGLRPAGRR
jgi:hypothetical protein